MREPRFISVDTSTLNDGDVLRYDVASHRIVGLAASQSGENLTPLAIRVIELTGNRTLTPEEVSARVLVFRGVLASPATLIFPPVAFCVLVMNQSAHLLTLARTGGSTTRSLAPNTGNDFYYIP